MTQQSKLRQSSLPHAAPAAKKRTSAPADTSALRRSPRLSSSSAALSENICSNKRLRKSLSPLPPVLAGPSIAASKPVTSHGVLARVRTMVKPNTTSNQNRIKSSSQTKPALANSARYSHIRAKVDTGLVRKASAVAPVVPLKEKSTNTVQNPKKSLINLVPTVSFDFSAKKSTTSDSKSALAQAIKPSAAVHDIKNTVAPVAPAKTDIEAAHESVGGAISVAKPQPDASSSTGSIKTLAVKPTTVESRLICLPKSSGKRSSLPVRKGLKNASSSSDHVSITTATGCKRDMHPDPDLMDVDPSPARMPKRVRINDPAHKRAAYRGLNKNQPVEPKKTVPYTKTVSLNFGDCESVLKPRKSIQTTNVTSQAESGIVMVGLVATKKGDIGVDMEICAPTPMNPALEKHHPVVAVANADVSATDSADVSGTTVAGSRIDTSVFVTGPEHENIQVPNVDIKPAVSNLDPFHNYNDPMLCSEYVEDIFAYFRETELRTMPVTVDYMDHQPDLDWDMRATLVSWLVEAHARLLLRPETLFVTVNLMDRFMALKQVSPNKYQLVGITCLMIAAKQDDAYHPRLNAFVRLADDAYLRDEVRNAEIYILNALDFDLSYPGPYNFMRRISAVDGYESMIRSMAKFVMEISIIDKAFVGVPPSMLAAAAMMMAHMMVKDEKWTAAHEEAAGYTQEQLRVMVDYMYQIVLLACKVGYQASAEVAEGRPLTAVAGAALVPIYIKYTSPHLEQVSLRAYNHLLAKGEL